MLLGDPGWEDLKISTHESLRTLLMVNNPVELNWTGTAVFTFPNS